VPGLTVDSRGTALADGVVQKAGDVQTLAEAESGALLGVHSLGMELVEREARPARSCGPPPNAGRDVDNAALLFLLGTERKATDLLERNCVAHGGQVVIGISERGSTIWIRTRMQVAAALLRSWGRSLQALAGIQDRLVEDVLALHSAMLLACVAALRKLHAVVPGAGDPGAE